MAQKLLDIRAATLSVALHSWAPRHTYIAPRLSAVQPSFTFFGSDEICPAPRIYCPHSSSPPIVAGTNGVVLPEFVPSVRLSEAGPFCATPGAFSACVLFPPPRPCRWRRHGWTRVRPNACCCSRRVLHTWTHLPRRCSRGIECRMTSLGYSPKAFLLIDTLSDPTAPFADPESPPPAWVHGSSGRV